MNRTTLTAIVVVSLLGGLALGYWSRNAPPVEINGTVLNPPREIQGFRLIDHHFQPFGPQSLKGKWTFMFFGYTFCPDICPTTMQVLSTMEGELLEHPAHGKIQVVFVSVDPQRDNPERLAVYVPYFNQNFLGVTGPQPDIDRFTRQLGILHLRLESEDNKTYLMDHSASVLLFNPDGELQALFSAPHDAAELARGFSAITDAL